MTEQLLNMTEPDADEGWELATEEALEMCLDDFVTVEVTIDKEFEKCLSDLETGGEEIASGTDAGPEANDIP